jgi:Tol biopolymer transport system component/DNA-binding winged helix-turn-helix (wHTH) protein
LCPSIQSAVVLRFRDFEFRPDLPELRKFGLRVKVERKPLLVLTVLLERPGELVSREELRKRLWQDDNTFVDFELGLNVAIKKLRDRLCDSAEDPRFIETFIGSGYSFIAPVQCVAPPEANKTTPRGHETAAFSAAQPPPAAPLHDAAAPAKRGLPWLWTRLQSRERTVNVAMALGAGLGLVISVLLAISWRSPSELPQVTEYQVTANPSSIPVSSAAVSPDGKLLAYTDPNGLFIREIASGEVHRVETSDEVRPDEVAWFPDSLTLLVGGESGVWKASVFGAGARKIAQDAPAFAVSPDGSNISYVRQHDGIWIVGPEGEAPHRIVPFSQSAESMSRLSWSPDGKHFTYARHWQTPNGVLGAIEVRKADGSSPETLTSNGGQAPCWVSDDTIVYSRAEPYPSRKINLWEIQVDSQTGKATSLPRQVTDWPQFSFRSPTATRDGRYVSFVRARWRTDVYLMDVVGDQVSPPYRFTFDEHNNWPATWSRDGQVMYFVSDRRGPAGVFQQPLGSRLASVVYARPDKDIGRPTLSPDGRWLLYSLENVGAEKSVHYLRVPVNGGAAESVFDAQLSSSIRCPRFSDASCVLEEFGVFTAFDSVSGRGRVLGRVPFNDADPLHWALSPDGTWIVFVQAEFAGLMDLSTGIIHQLHFDQDYTPEDLIWSTEGKRLIGLHNSADRSGAAVIFGADLDGRTRVLARLPGEIIGDLTVSPDGQHLAFTSVREDNNVWMIDRQPRRSLPATFDSR